MSPTVIVPFCGVYVLNSKTCKYYDFYKRERFMLVLEYSNRFMESIRGSPNTTNDQKMLFFPNPANHQDTAPEQHGRDADLLDSRIQRNQDA